MSELGTKLASKTSVRAGGGECEEVEGGEENEGGEDNERNGKYTRVGTEDYLAGSLRTTPPAFPGQHLGAEQASDGGGLTRFQRRLRPPGGPGRLQDWAG